MTEKSKILITCAKRITPYLKKEVEALGFPIITEKQTGIETEGTLEDTMKLNFFLRTPNLVLFELEEYVVEDPEVLYRNLKNIPWEDYIEKDGYVCVTSSVSTPSITNTQFANVRVKDAIVDRFTEKFGERPDSGPERNRAAVHLYWYDEKAVIYLNTSGETLLKHGYRKMPFKAPMQEALASAVILASKWDQESNFINPMCGSGTLAIEAAIIALNRAPGLLRRNYGFMHLKGYNEELFNEMRRQSRLAAKKDFNGRIIATDMSNMAIEAAKQNAMTAGVDKHIEFKVCDFSETEIPEGGGVVIINPEYGDRLGEEEKLVPLYRAMGDFFKKNCQGYTGYIFTGNQALSKKIGLKASRKIEFYNTTIDCRLLEYELYMGTRKEVEE